MALYRQPPDSKEQQLKRLLETLIAEEEPSTAPTYPNHVEAIEPWKRAMTSGTLTGRAFSHHTVENYARYVKEYFTQHPQLTIEAFRLELEKTPAEQFGRRDKYFKGLLCFAKFLVREASLPQLFIDKALAMKPKRHLPARQVSLNEEQLQKLIAQCKTSLERLIIQLLSSTGLRASEFCALKVQDLYLEEGYLIVQRGKGGKRRRVGLTPQCVDGLKSHVAVLRLTEPIQPVFYDRFGQPMVRDGLLHRLKRLGKEAGVDVSPHALRRAFVTINANKGRSLVMLQMACGHSDIKTTRSYCKTTEDEVISAMQGW